MVSSSISGVSSSSTRNSNNSSNNSSVGSKRSGTGCLVSTPAAAVYSSALLKARSCSSQSERLRVPGGAGGAGVGVQGLAGVPADKLAGDGML
jgi:hypothetical protein